MFTQIKLQRQLQYYDATTGKWLEKEGKEADVPGNIRTGKARYTQSEPQNSISEKIEKAKLVIEKAEKSIQKIKELDSGIIGLANRKVDSKGFDTEIEKFIKTDYQNFFPDLERFKRREGNPNLLNPYAYDLDKDEYIEALQGRIKLEKRIIEEIEGLKDYVSSNVNAEALKSSQETPVTSSDEIIKLRLKELVTKGEYRNADGAGYAQIYLSTFDAAGYGNGRYHVGENGFHGADRDLGEQTAQALVNFASDEMSSETAQALSQEFREMGFKIEYAPEKTPTLER